METYKVTAQAGMVYPELSYEGVIALTGINPRKQTGTVRARSIWNSRVELVWTVEAN